MAGLTPVLLMLQNNVIPTLAVEVLPLGLHISQILLNADGRSHDVLIGPLDNREHASKRMFQNCVVGRYANRLPVGEFEVEKDGEKGTVKPISNESPTVSLHGGPVGFDRLVWNQIDAQTCKNFSPKEAARIEALDSEAVGIFSLTSPAGDQGFPGELYTEVLFALLEPPQKTIRDSGEIEIGALALVYRSRLVSGQKPVATPVMLTQHWGFNLSASIQPPAPNPSVNTHSLKIASAGTIDLADTFLATGNITTTKKDSPYDHTTAKLIGDRAPSQGYDEYYLFENAQDSEQPIHVKLDAWENGDLLEEIFEYHDKEKPVELYSNDSGLRAEFQTNQPGVQLYTGEGLNGSGSKKLIHGGTFSNGGYNKRAAAFLEFHEPHAAWLHPWGAKGDTIISTKDMYHNYTKVIFSYQHHR